MNKLRAVLFLLLLFGLSALSLTAQSLYGSGIPAESALVRCILLNETDRTSLFLGGVRLPLDEPGVIPPYYPIGSGMYFVSAGGQEIEMFARSGAYYTLVLSGSGIQLFEDSAHDDPVRSQLYLYNLTDSPCTLEADGAGTVFDSLNGGESAQVALNPLKIGFTLRNGDKEYHWDSLPLERGGSVTLLLYGKGALAEEAQVGTLE
ncbi:MAG: alginate O-acetyltransferase AlgF [Spirochaetales bacterium]|nr:alginate O-acetyltransferase AlgF [Spirochaetales bacterium]